MSELDDLIAVIAPALGKSPAGLRAEVERFRTRKRQRAVKNNDRYYEALERITEEQTKTILALRALGAKTWDKLRQNRDTGNVCIFLSREAWNPAKGRMGTKLYAVYPDGSRTETFERSISVRAKF